MKRAYTSPVDDAVSVAPENERQVRARGKARKPKRRIPRTSLITQAAEKEALEAELEIEARNEQEHEDDSDDAFADPEDPTGVAIDIESQRTNDTTLSHEDGWNQGRRGVAFSGPPPVKYNLIADRWLRISPHTAKIYIRQETPVRIELDHTELARLPNYDLFKKHVIEHLWRGDDARIRWTVFVRGKQQAGTDVLELRGEPAAAARWQARQDQMARQTLARQGMKDDDYRDPPRRSRDRDRDTDRDEDDDPPRRSRERDREERDEPRRYQRDEQYELRHRMDRIELMLERIATQPPAQQFVPTQQIAQQAQAQTAENAALGAMVNQFGRMTEAMMLSMQNAANRTGGFNPEVQSAISQMAEAQGKLMGTLQATLAHPAPNPAPVPVAAPTPQPSLTDQVSDMARSMKAFRDAAGVFGMASPGQHEAQPQPKLWDIVKVGETNLGVDRNGNPLPTFQQIALNFDRIEGIAKMFFNKFESELKARREEANGERQLKAMQTEFQGVIDKLVGERNQLFSQLEARSRAEQSRAEHARTVIDVQGENGHDESPPQASARSQPSAASSAANFSSSTLRSRLGLAS